jgi:hypothetical protein
MGPTESLREALEETPVPQLPPEAEQPQAWELIDTGRYMPRRIRGSFRGRVLG